MKKKKFSGMKAAFKKQSQEQIEKWSNELISLLKTTIEKEPDRVEEYVEHLRKLNRGISKDDLAKKIVSRRSLKAAGVGTITNVGGLITFPVTMPSNLYINFRNQARMVLSLAYLYGWNIRDEDIATDILLVMGGTGVTNTLDKIGIKLGQEYTKKTVNKYITREVMKKVNRVVSRKIISKAGQKSIVSFSRLVPVIAAPIGGTIDYLSTIILAKAALKFYRR
jgi:hypothetical protein